MSWRLLVLSELLYEYGTLGLVWQAPRLIMEKTERLMDITEQLQKELFRATENQIQDVRRTGELSKLMAELKEIIKYYKENKDS